MDLGKLKWNELSGRGDLVADVVYSHLSEDQLREVFVAEIDPDLADTAKFCEKYNIGLDISANCVIVKAKRADRVWYVALMIMATDRADVNKVVKKHLNARKLSFAPMDEAVELTKMEYGGITPIGLPQDWQILVDEKVSRSEKLVIGSGIRGSKLVVSGEFLAKLPNSEVLKISI